MTTLFNSKQKPLSTTLTSLSLALLLSSINQVHAAEEKLYPLSITSQQGYHSDQSLDVLKKLEQTGNDNDWPTYIEFTSNDRRYKGIMHFQAPANATIDSMALEVNYLGPQRSDQTWKWQLWSEKEQKWLLVGNNKNAPSWSWSSMTFYPPGSPSDYIGEKRSIRLRYLSNNGVDNSDLDYLTLNIEATYSDNGGTTPLPPPNTEIWRPEPGSSWQWQLSGEIDTSIAADIYDIDLFDAPEETIASLKQKGVKIICYFSAGSYEDWRTDAASFPQNVLGKDNGWPGEQWLDIRRTDLLIPIMEKRLDLAVTKGCDAVEPDNIDAYANDSGFNLTAEHQLQYNQLLATEAHERKLSIGLKNDVGQVAELLPWFDWALNESCLKYSECEQLLPFIQQGKAVFHTEYIEYGLTAEEVCPTTNQLGFSTLIKNRNLDPWRINCLDWKP